MIIQTNPLHLQECTVTITALCYTQMHFTFG